MHLFVPLLHKEVQKFAANFRTGQHEDLILNDNAPSTRAQRRTARGSQKNVREISILASPCPQWLTMLFRLLHGVDSLLGALLDAVADIFGALLDAAARLLGAGLRRAAGLRRPLSPYLSPRPSRPSSVSLAGNLGAFLRILRRCLRALLRVFRRLSCSRVLGGDLGRSPSCRCLSLAVLVPFCRVLRRGLGRVSSRPCPLDFLSRARVLRRQTAPPPAEQPARIAANFVFIRPPKVVPGSLAV